MASKLPSDILDDSHLFESNESEDDQVLAEIQTTSRMTGQPPSTSILEKKRKHESSSSSSSENSDASYHPSSSDDESSKNLTNQQDNPK